jgi:hypothetical protein
LGRTESVIFVDDAVPPAMAQLLVDAHPGKLGGRWPVWPPPPATCWTAAGRGAGDGAAEADKEAAELDGPENGGSKNGPEEDEARMPIPYRARRLDASVLGWACSSSPPRLGSAGPLVRPRIRQAARRRSPVSRGGRRRGHVSAEISTLVVGPSPERCG